ncbi:MULTISPECIES: hypothetical protein [Microbacterium]|uniref:hypothetical protein n=1 Tax=Microbacterium TaxID=33882 RepID=UPI0013A5435A|nr:MULTISPECIES: hypothetical protein [Microbacterium]
MSDPISGVAIGALAKAADSTSAEAAKTAGGLLTRLLGPSADVIGNGWADSIRRRNTARVLEKAVKKVEAHGHHDNASLRLVASTLAASEFADNEIVAEYLSGVLASGAAEGGADDSGLQWTAMISRLSSLQLRAHFAIYVAALGAARADDQIGDPYPLWGGIGPHKGRGFTVKLDAHSFVTDSEHKRPGFEDMLAESLDGLTREQLIGDFVGLDSMFVELTFDGVALFLRAIGTGLRPSRFLEIDPTAALEQVGMALPHAAILPEPVETIFAPKAAESSTS